MANAKLSPRQRMINMMYLVLIALLVLNVDKRILKSFHLMEKNIIGSSGNLDEKNDLIMSGFLRNLKTDEEKTKPYYEKALEAERIAEEFNHYIDQVKKDIEELYGGRLEEEVNEKGLKALKTPEKMEAHAHYFMVENKGARALELQRRINETKDKLLALLKPDGDSLFTTNEIYLAVSRANQLHAEDPPNIGPKNLNWANINLEYQPAGAIMALLSQLQFNAKSLESDVLTKLAEGIHLLDFKFNRISAEILPMSNYVMEGEPYQAKIMLVASNTSSDHKILVNGNPWDNINDGIGELELPTSGVGEKEVDGYILVHNPKTNRIDSFYFKNSYQVFRPAATVALDEMNLLYTEIDNPVSISVPGFSAADLEVRSSEGSVIRGSNGKFIIRVDGSQRKVKVSVSAKGKPMGVTEYRVRNLPLPTARYGGLVLSGGPVPKAAAAAQRTLLASLGSDFAYNLTYRVSSFTAYFIPSNGPYKTFRVNGSQIPDGLRQLINSAAKNSKVVIENIKAIDSRTGLEKKVENVLFFTLN